MDPTDTASKKVDKYRHITESRENYKQIFTFSQCYTLVCMETCVKHVSPFSLFFLPLLSSSQDSPVFSTPLLFLRGA